ncbi:MAG: tetratricopeptide repeat protein, partial [Myxococcales bacterium]
ANSGPQSFNVTAHGKTPQVSFHGKVEELRQGTKENKPQSPTESMAAQRDERSTRLQQRALGLLVTEIHQLEGLLRITEDNSKDRVTLLRRLAENYVELENAAFREKTEAEIDRDNVRRTDPNAAGQKETLVRQRTETLRLARGSAIKYYTILAKEYGGDPSARFPSPPTTYPQLDEVLYYLAYEYEQAGDFENARKYYFELVQKAPKSKFVANAYLAFGELFFTQAQSNPAMWEGARKAYEKVLESPPPDNKVYGYALYKLGYVYWNTNDLPKALECFRKTIEFGMQWSSLPNSTKRAESARKDIIPVYALGGSPEKAFDDFRKISGDQGGATAKTYQMMLDLGVNYIDTGHYGDAITLFRDLLRRDAGGERTCAYQSRISEATMAMKSGKKPEIVAELDNQMRRYNAFKAERHSAEALQECANRTAALLTETAMAWHLEAIGGGAGQRGTSNTSTIGLAADLYGKVAKTFTTAEFEKFTFPRLVREDWPTMYRIKYNMADLLYAQERWKECGPAFDSVVVENPSAPEAPEAAWAAVLCYQKM